MKIAAIKISIFELPGNTSRFDLEEVVDGARRCWHRRHHSKASEHVHVLHVLTDEGIEGVCTVGDARSSSPAYYNFASGSVEKAVEDAQQAVASGLFAVKDHFHFNPAENIRGFAAVRAAVGPDVALFHDAATCQYTFQEALRVGRALEEFGFAWFEEPLPDRDQIGLQQLCAALDIPVLAPETLMHDIDLNALWLRTGAVDLLRANARHGTTSLLKLAHLAQLRNTSVELNGPGGLFGLVHAHLVCAIPNTSYYEYFPGGSRDELGKEIGLLNPPLPQKGRIAPPPGPGWGAEWDRQYFEKKKIGEL